MNMHDKLLKLFEQRVNDDCSIKSTRTLLCPIIAYLDSRERDWAAKIRKKMFAEVCTEFQWFYWSAEDYYGGVGDWREFPPICASQLNKAIRSDKSSVQITMAQRQYLIDFNEMTKRTVQDNTTIHYGVPIFVKAFKKEGFRIDKFFDVLDRLNQKSEQHSTIVSGLFKLLRSSEVEPLDMELANNTLTLLYRLITREGMAQQFLERDEIIATLLNLRCVETPNTDDNNSTTSLATQIHTIISLLMCHYINSESGQLSEAYEEMIRATTQGHPISLLEATSRRHSMRARRYQNDPKRVFRLLAPLAAVAPKVFVESINKCLSMKKNELHLKEREKNADPTTSANINKHSNLTKILNSLISQLLSTSKSSSIKSDYVFQPTNLLKFLSELLRNYSAAPAIFIQLATPNGQNVLKSIIDTFVLKKINANAAEEKNAAEIALSAKAVLSSLISGNTTSEVTDQIVEDLKALLFAITEDYMKGVCDCPNATEKAKIGIKYADLLSLIAHLVMLLRETALQQKPNANQQTIDKQVGILLLRSIHKQNLLNDFVRAIWTLPLHERQGVEAVNTLLKMFEGIISKDNNGQSIYGRDGNFQPPAATDTQTFTENTDANATFADIQTSNIFPMRTTDTEATAADGNAGQMDVEEHTAQSNTGPEGGERQTAAATANTTSIIDGSEGRHQEVEAEIITAVEHDQDDDEDEAMDDTQQSPDTRTLHTPPGETSSEQTDEDMQEEEEDMEDDHGGHAQQIAAPMGENAIYDNLNFGEGAHHHHHHFGEEEEVEVHHHHNHEENNMYENMDDDEEDDDDEEEDEEEEGEENGAVANMQLINFEMPEPLMDMADFAHLHNEMNLIRQDINRINMNINNLNQAAIATQHIQQALMQIPRNIRQFVGHHPRGGAVLRIRDGHHFGRDPRLHRGGQLHIGFNIRGDRNNMIAQLMNHFANGQWPGIEPAPQHQIPYFLDRLSDQCRILDPSTVFHIATILISYLLPVIEVPPDEKNTTPAAPTSTQRQQPEDGGNGMGGSALPDNPQQVDGIPVPDGMNPAALPAELQQQQPEDGGTGGGAPHGNSQQIGGTPVPDAVNPADVPNEMRQQQPEDGGTGGGAPHGNPQQIDGAPPPPPRDNPQQVDGVPVPDGVDPAFLAALPEEMRQEVLRDHLLQQQMNAAPAAQQNDQDLPPERLAAILGMEVPEGMDPAFLAALPEDIFQEVVRDHQRQQENNRQRQIRRQAAIRHHHHQHHRHFAMPLFGRFARAGGNNPQEMPTTLSNKRALQLLDNESISTLILLYLLENDKYKFNFVRLQKLLRYICVHPASCDFTVWALISLLDGLEHFGTTDMEGESGKHQTGWVNNFRMCMSMDKNERVLQITPNSIHINQQIRNTAANNVLDTLCYLAQKFAAHFLPNDPTSSGNKPQQQQLTNQPKKNAIFWNTVRCINGKNTEDALKASALVTVPTSNEAAAVEDMSEAALQNTPFAFILKLAGSKMAKSGHGFMEKLIRTTLMLSQNLKKPENAEGLNGTKDWVAGQLKELHNILMENSTDESLENGRALIVKMLEIYPSERQAIMGALHEGILVNADGLITQFKGLQTELDSRNVDKEQ